MGFKSAKNTRNVNNSNGNYEVDGLIFPSRFVFLTIASIDRNLRFLYTPGSEDMILNQYSILQSEIMIANLMQYSQESKSGLVEL